VGFGGELLEDAGSADGHGGDETRNWREWGSGVDVREEEEERYAF
jgi:hypothetical protein